MRFFLSLVFALLSLNILAGQKMSIDDYNVVWDQRSKNSSESMPCGGGDIGVNVWLVGSCVNMYFSRNGAFDENNVLLKLGRLRIETEGTNPYNPFFDFFQQELRLSDGSIYIKGVGGTEVRIWVDIFHPVIHIDYTCDHPREFTVRYENWRTKPQTFYDEDAHISGLQGTKDGMTIYPDSVGFDGDQILFFHRNRNDFILSKTVDIDERTDIKDGLYNPVRNLTFGGIIQGDGLVMGKMFTGGCNYGIDYNLWTLVSKKPQKTCHITITTNIEQTETLAEWEKDLKTIQKRQLAKSSKDRKASEKWWQQFWQRSFICANESSLNSNLSTLNSKADTAFMISRNYQLFRYMLACNAYGDCPTKFNGSLFTFDPGSVEDDKEHLSPDIRQWGGALTTAHNPRNVYWPLLKSGDWDMMDSDLKSQHNAELIHMPPKQFRDVEVINSKDSISCVRLGMLPEAKALVIRKLQNGCHRFPAFFGSGHYWTPDNNWGLTGMSALQEMLLQTVGDTMYILPCWPREWDVHFRLHAPNQTTVDVDYHDGKIQSRFVSSEFKWNIVELPEF